MNKNLIFQDTSIGNNFAIILFFILIFFLLIGLSMFSSIVRNKMGYESKQNDYKYHIGVFIVLGIVGILCMDWKINKIDEIDLVSNKLVLKGFFGNEIASFAPEEITDVKTDFHPSRKSTASDTYIVFIHANGKEYSTNYLLSEEAYDLCLQIKRVTKKAMPWEM